MRNLMALAVVALTSSQAGAAAKTITLLGVSGPGGEKLANELETDLSDLYEVISGDVYRATAAKMGRAGASAEEVQAVARRLRIDAIIGASIVGTGRNRQILVAVREGVSGRVVARGSYQVGNRKLLRDRVVADLVKALDRAAPTPGRRGGDDDGDAGASAGASGEGDTSTTVTRRAPAKERPVSGFTAALGPSLLRRSFTTDGSASPAYDSGTLVGLRVAASVFPFAIASGFAADHPVLASFGLFGGYEHVFDYGATTTTGASTGHGARWNLGFAGRIPLGHRAVGGYLQVETGYQNLYFAHDNPAAVGIPNAAYDIINAGLSWDRTLGVPWVRLDVRFDALAPVTAGDLVTQAGYGRGSAWGIDVAGGLTFLPVRFLTIRLDAGYTRIGLNYKGTGNLLAHSSADSIPSGSLQLAFAL
jgi:hypothetical protein